MDRFEEILEYWFDDLSDPTTRVGLWFGKNPETDREICERFEEDVERAGRGEYDSWMEESRSCLALIILLDQFTRNIYRDSPRAFAFDDKAREAALNAIERGFDGGYKHFERGFVYLPFEHAEDIELQEKSVKLFDELAKDAPGGFKEIFRIFYDYAVKHRDIIARFGRFPHRNSILGRESSPEEIEFLKEPDSSF